MKTPSFLEFRIIVEYISEHIAGAQLQEIFSRDEGLVLCFYCFTKVGPVPPSVQYLVFDLDMAFPFLGLFTKNPWSGKKVTKPVGLFLNSHAKNLFLSEVSIREQFGRVLLITLGDSNFSTTLEFRMIPKQANLIVRHGKKAISWYPQKTLTEVDVELNERGEEARSIPFIFEHWSQRRSFMMKSDGAETSFGFDPYNKWKIQREKDLVKKKKALIEIEIQIQKLKNSEWHLVGEHLKITGRKDVKPEWSIYINFEKSVSDNIQTCFERAKSNKQKILGAEARKLKIEQEIVDYSNFSQIEFELSQKKISLKRETNSNRKVEGRLRKFNLESGGVAFLGKSAADNLMLLRRAKPYDIWLHLKDYPSSHAIIHCNKNQVIPEPEIALVSKWLIKEGLSSKLLKLGEKFSVVIVECRHVKPIKGDKMGRVTYHHGRELLIVA